MHVSRIVGIGLLVAGVIMLFMGWNATESVTEGVSEALTGSYTENTRRYLIGGGVAAAIGVALLLFGAKR